MTSTNIGALVDTYGKINAQIADLDLQVKALKAALAEVPAGSYEGDLFRLSISDKVLESPDEELKARIKEVTEAFTAGLSRQYLTAHTVEKPSRTHRISGRKAA